MIMITFIGYDYNNLHWYDYNQIIGKPNKKADFGIR